MISSIVVYAKILAWLYGWMLTVSGLTAWNALEDEEKFKVGKYYIVYGKIIIGNLPYYFLSFYVGCFITLSTLVAFIYLYFFQGGEVEVIRELKEIKKTVLLLSSSEVFESQAKEYFYGRVKLHPNKYAHFLELSKSKGWDRRKIKFGHFDDIEEFPSFSNIESFAREYILVLSDAAYFSLIIENPSKYGWETYPFYGEWGLRSLSDDVFWKIMGARKELEKKVTIIDQ